MPERANVAPMEPYRPESPNIVHVTSTYMHVSACMRGRAERRVQMLIVNDSLERRANF